MIKAGSLSGRPDFLSLFSHLCDKDEERGLLFILVFQRGRISLLGTLAPLGYWRCGHAPGHRLEALAGVWGGTALSSGHMNSQSPLAFIPVPRGPLDFAALCQGSNEGLSWGRIAA